KRGYVERRLLLDGDEATVALPTKADWIVVNSGGHGFYRVRYAGPLLKKLAGAVAKIAPIERFNLLSDAFALVQAALMAPPPHPDLTARLTAENHPHLRAPLDPPLAPRN